MLDQLYPSGISQPLTQAEVPSPPERKRSISQLQQLGIRLPRPQPHVSFSGWPRLEPMDKASRCSPTDHFRKPGSRLMEVKHLDGQQTPGRYRSAPWRLRPRRDEDTKPTPRKPFHQYVTEPQNDLAECACSFFPFWRICNYEVALLVDSALALKVWQSLISGTESLNKLSFSGMCNVLKETGCKYKREKKSFAATVEENWQIKDVCASVHVF